jgi:hypothetical protein
MSSYISLLAQKYRDKGVLIDTNLLLLIAVGNYNRAIISKFKRTAKFTVDDFDLITQILKFFKTKVSTPNILTEVDNLARQLPSNEYRAISAALRELIANTFERYVPAIEASQSNLYPQLGLTDSIIVEYPTDILIVTDDFSLYQRLERNRDVININHIREFRF